MSPAGSRDLHKRRRAAQVLDAAEILFAQKGYEATRMEEIASNASVAPATVYNYFSTKPNLLMELALRHVLMVLPERRAFVRDPPPDPIAGLKAFEHLLAHQAMQRLSRECWRIILSTHLEPNGQAYRTGSRLNLLIWRQYIRLLRTYQSRGRLSREVDSLVLAELIVGITAWNFARYIASPNMTLDDLQRKSASHLELIIAGHLVPGDSSTSVG